MLHIKAFFGNYYDIKLRYQPLYVLYLFAGQLFGGPINEEFGWQGFVLPRLQRKFNPLIAGIITGIIHAAWHMLRNKDKKVVEVYANTAV